MPHDRRATDRNFYVVKSNDLIRNARYDLTARKQKIILFLISKIKPNDPITTQYTFTIKDLCHACGLSIDDGGIYYKLIRDDLMDLTQRGCLEFPDGEAISISWIGDIRWHKKSGTVDIFFNQNMEPYLFDLQEKYTQYKLINALAFKSGHTIRLYEILRSYITARQIEKTLREYYVEIELPKLREMLGVDDAYSLWTDFNRYVLKKSVDEINKYADDIHVEYEAKKDGRSVRAVEFVIRGARALQQMSSHDERRRRLNKH